MRCEVLNTGAFARGNRLLRKHLGREHSNTLFNSLLTEDGLGGVEMGCQVSCQCRGSERVDGHMQHAIKINMLSRPIKALCVMRRTGNRAVLGTVA